MNKLGFKLPTIVLLTFILSLFLSANLYANDGPNVSEEHYKEIIYISGNHENKWRYELSDYIGKEYSELLLDTDLVALKEEKKDGIKLGNDYASITADNDGIIVRVRIDNEEDTLCVLGICPDMVTSDAHYLLDKEGYTKGKMSEDGEWIIFENKEDNTFFAYQSVYGSITQIYYGLVGYMPFKQKE